MKTHYSYTPINRHTACGRLTKDVQPRITHNSSEVTCKSCMTCLESYLDRQQELVWSTNHLSNEGLLAEVMQRAAGLRDYYSIEEVTNLFQVLVSRLVDIGFISRLDELLIDWYYY